MNLQRGCRWILILAAGVWARAQTTAGKVAPDFAAFARATITTLPAPPPWDPKQPAAVWTVDDVNAEFAKVTDRPPQVNSLRTNLLRPDHRWLTDLSGWFRKAQKSLQVRYVDELWDCDNYASCFVAFADLIALKGGETRGSFCIGWATVYYARPFAGIRAGAAHAVVVVGTSKGLFVVEPQDGTMVALAKFPNRDTIENVFF